MRALLRKLAGLLVCQDPAENRNYDEREQAARLREGRMPK